VCRGSQSACRGIWRDKSFEQILLILLLPCAANAATSSQNNDPFDIFRLHGERLAEAGWATGIDQESDQHEQSADFDASATFKAHAHHNTKQHLESFLKGRYQRSRARQVEPDGWRAQPNISNPGTDLANFPDSAFTLPQGRAYIELAPFSYYGGSSIQPQEFATEYLIRYGATDDIELRLFGSGYNWVGGQVSTWSFAPLGFDVKIQSWLERPEYFLPAMGVEIYLQTEWLGNTATNGGTQPGISFNFDQSLPWEIDFEYNLGAARVQDFQSGENEWEFGFQWAFQRDFFDKDFSLFIHGYHDTTRRRRVSSSTSPSQFDGITNFSEDAVGGGFIWTANDRLSIYGQTSAGLNQFSPSLISYTGFAVAF
jgi:hypothetical protein